MTCKTPLHLQRVHARGQWHVPHITVASLTRDAAGHVRPVIEVDEVGEIVNPRPLESFAGGETGADGLEHGGVGEQLGMASHAHLRRRQARERRRFDGFVAVSTIDSVGACVVLVTEGHGLLDRRAAGVGIVDPCAPGDHCRGCRDWN